MRKVFLYTVATLVLSACTQPKRTISEYKLETYNDSDVPVCVKYEQKATIIKKGHYEVGSCGDKFFVPPQYEPIKDSCNKEKVSVVPYDYCLAQLPKPVHLVEKKDNDMTICYDRNNKVKLPILYCQKDMVNIQTVDVKTSVIQRTNVLQKTGIRF